MCLSSLVSPEHVSSSAFLQVNSNQRSLADRIEPSLCVLAVVPLVQPPLLVLLPQAPESLLESLETHLNTLEGKKP